MHPVFPAVSFAIGAYTDQGGGLVILLADRAGNSQRILATMESSAHLEHMISALMATGFPNETGQVGDIDPEDTDHPAVLFLEHRPSITPSHLGSFTRREFRNRFNVSDFDGYVAIETASLDNEEQLFLLSPFLAALFLEHLVVVRRRLVA